MKNIIVASLILIVLSCVFLEVSNVQGQSSSVIVDPSANFGFSNGWLNFANTETFSQIFEYESGNYWYFDFVGISLDGANCTVLTWIQNNETILNLTSISDPCVVLLDLSTLKTDVSVSGATSSKFNATSGILNVTKTSFSYAVITLKFSPIYITNVQVTNFNLAPNVPFTLEATVYDEWGTTYLSSFVLEFSAEYQIAVSWSAGAFTLPYGSSACTLDPTKSSVTQIDANTYQFSFALTLTGSAAETATDVLSGGTLASDSFGNTATNNQTNIATYSGQSSGPGPGPGPSPSPSPSPSPNPTNSTNPGNGNNTNTNPTIPPVTISLPFSPTYLAFGIVVIFGVVALVGYYSGKKRRNPLNDARKEFEKQGKSNPIKWDKDQD